MGRHVLVRMIVAILAPPPKLVRNPDLHHPLIRPLPRARYLDRPGVARNTA